MKRGVEKTKTKKKKRQKKEKEEKTTTMPPKNYNEMMIAVHRERCEADLMYALFQMPEKKVRMGTLVDCILFAFWEICAKKNNPDFDRSSRIAKAAAWLKTEQADVPVKLFNILCMINREPELQDVIRSGFQARHPGNFWSVGENDKTNTDWHRHFDWFLDRLSEMVEMTLNFPYNEIGIPTMVRDFVHEARKFYLIRGE